MKIADPDSIKAGEQGLINAIMETLNSEIIESIASGKLAIENLEFRNGDMVIHGDRIVYKMEFETSVSVAVMFDRDGNLIPDDASPEALSAEEQETGDSEAGLSDGSTQTETPDEETLSASEESVPEDFAPEETALAESASEGGMAEETDGSSEVMPDEESSGDEGVPELVEKNREFWLKQTQDGIEPVDTAGSDPAKEGGGPDTEIEGLIQKNRGFWEAQAENPVAGG